MRHDEITGKAAKTKAGRVANSLAMHPKVFKEPEGLQFGKTPEGQDFPWNRRNRRTIGRKRRARGFVRPSMSAQKAWPSSLEMSVPGGLDMCIERPRSKRTGELLPVDA